MILVTNSQRVYVSVHQKVSSSCQRLLFCRFPRAFSSGPRQTFCRRQSTHCLRHYQLMMQGRPRGPQWIQSLHLTQSIKQLWTLLSCLEIPKSFECTRPVFEYSNAVSNSEQRPNTLSLNNSDFFQRLNNLQVASNTQKYHVGIYTIYLFILPNSPLIKYLRACIE